MRQAMKAVFSSLFAVGLLSSVSAVQADWQETLGNLWSTTKAGAEQLTETVKGEVDKRFKPKETVEIGIAYGTEKKAWLQWAVEEFAKTENGKQIKINLIPKGSVEGAEVILEQGDDAKKIHVWSPASSVVQSLLAEPWEAEHGNDPIKSDAPLALTPMVMVMWEDRYDAFVKKYTDVDFNTIASALNEETGWQAIAEKADWGMFTFGHTLPTHSNSDLRGSFLCSASPAEI